MDNEISLLSFDDWRTSKEEAKDWTIVARSWKEKASNYITFSAMASNADDSLERLLATHQWDVMQAGFGYPGFYSENAEPVAHFDPGPTTVNKGILFRPLVICRNTSRLIKTQYQLDQTFLLYHDAIFVPERGEYQHIDENGDLVTVARLRRDGDNIELLVGTRYLRDYLAANQAYLVRYHYHVRRSSQNIDDQVSVELRQRTFQGRNFRYNVYIDLRKREPYTTGVLNGKDIIFPFSEPDPSRTEFATGQSNRKYTTFIVDSDERGEEVESTCDVDYEHKPGAAPFLTPVFFTREVLHKYYQEPSRYSVQPISIVGHGIFSIDIDLTDEALVMVWLGDLGKLPYKEQMHWRQYNVIPRGTMTENRFRRDLLGEFIASELNTAQEFQRVFKELQRLTEAVYGESLFKELNPADQHAFDALHLPITEEQLEFDQQVQALAKVTCDSLNVKFLARTTGKKIGDENIKGSIDLLLVFLKQICVDEAVEKQVGDALRNIQTLRSSGSAHRKGSDYDKTLQRLGLEGLSHRAQFEKLTAGTAIVCTVIHEVVSNSKSAGPSSKDTDTHMS